MNYNNDSESMPVAVKCRGVKKQLGHGKQRMDVLCGLNMAVPYGAIYGLLGPSGCGKTTLLKCIVGRSHFAKGYIRTMGKTPGSKGHLVPGRMIGYMPQELALFLRFSIGETLYFFGRLHGMTSQGINSRMEFLLGFLSLPDHKRLVDDLSGGQQRRVSLAAALLQEPELLVLDEPTVGVDPVLREKIWEHLLDIAKSSLKTTIIITTHYIEEAALADKVGLMRGGRILAESKPSVLMSRFNLPNLEAVFLHLCHRDRLPNNDDDEELLPSVSEPLPSVDIEQEEDSIYSRYSPAEDKVHLLGGPSSPTLYGTLASGWSPRHWRQNCDPWSALPSVRNVMALCGKNLTSMKRDITHLVFEFVVPLIQIVLFCTCIGREPRDLQVSVVNEDRDELGDLALSCLNNRTIVQVRRDSLDAALYDVRMGYSWSALHLRQNFSFDLLTRLEDGLHVSNETIEGGTMWLYMDHTNQQIATIIQARVYQGFEDFLRKLLRSFEYNPDLASIPVGLGKPVYGTSETSFTDFMAEGLIVSATFFLATGLTLITFILERKEGLIERMYVAGVTSVELMLSHLVTQMMVMFGQVLFMFLLALLAFNLPNNGNIVTVVTLVMLQGLCGMTLGMVISAACQTETSAIQVVLGVMYPSLLLSGIIWPIEAMPQWMTDMAKFLPMTFPTYAVRAIMGRGWGLDMALVWSSYLISWAWIIIHSVAAVVILKFLA